VSPRRREQAEATRAVILDAAERLFLRDGYASTPMPAVAAEANVALKTVYVVFTTKSRLLHELWNVRLGGDAEPVPVVARPWYQNLIAEPDPEQLLRRFAAQSRQVKERAGALMTVIRNGAGADPAVASLWRLIQDEFHEVLRPIAARLHEQGALAEHLTVTTTTDLLWTLNHPDVWHLLCVERGWSADAYQNWLIHSFQTQLLPARPRPEATPGHVH
jgi:AcrR family transcriptional regulator